MSKAKKAKEIVINTINEVGALAEISQIVSQLGIDIRALSCRVEGVQSVIHMITDDNSAAVEALKKKNFEPFELEAVLIELSNRPGVLKRVITEFQARGIKVGYLYATALKNHDRCLMVASTSDIEKTVEAASKFK